MTIFEFRQSIESMPLWTVLIPPVGVVVFYYLGSKVENWLNGTPPKDRGPVRKRDELANRK